VSPLVANVAWAAVFIAKADGGTCRLAGTDQNDFLHSKPNMNDVVTFYTQDWKPEGKAKAVICLVHGLGEHTGRYEHVGKALNEAGFSLFGFDMCGHGNSGSPRGHFP